MRPGPWLLPLLSKAALPRGGSGEREVFFGPGVHLENGLALLFAEAFGGALRFLAGGNGHGGGAGSARFEEAAEALSFSGAEKSDEQLVFAGNEILGAARFALPSGATDELAVDAGGQVMFDDNDMKAAEFEDFFGEFYVGAATSHVRRDRDATALTGVLDDGRFLFVANRVED